MHLDYDLKMNDSRRTKRPMQQTTMMGFLKKKKAAEDEVLKESVVESNSSVSEESLIDTSADCIMPSASTASIQVETIPIESKSTRPALSQEECKALIEEFFEGRVHNYYTCFNKCSKLSEQEIERIKPKKFSHDWVENIDNWWLCHVEGQGMFCIICKKHGVVNRQNKTDKFTAAASDRFESDAIETHKKIRAPSECFRKRDNVKNVCFPQRDFGEKGDRSICFRENLFNSLFSDERVFVKQKISAIN